MSVSRKWIVPAASIAVVAIIAGLLWYTLRPTGLGDGFASGNGRIEATDVDVASKLPGRIASIDVEEGQFIQPGQIIARMDTQVLEAQLAQAQAQMRQAQNSQLTARAQVRLRESEKVTAEAIVRQRQAEVSAAQKRHGRSAILVKRNAMAQQQLDDDLARLQSTQAALAAAQSQVISAEAGIAAAQSQVIEAQSAVEATQASVARLQIDIEDSQLKAPRGGRVQYRIAEPGEVIGAGGKVLNLVDLSGG